MAIESFGAIIAKEIGKIAETAIKELPKKQLENFKVGDGVLGKLKDIKNLTPEQLCEKMKEYFSQKGEGLEKLFQGLPKTGEFLGEIGNSPWKPNLDEVPKKFNPEGKTWREILDKYGIDSIEFKNGYPDFSKIAKGEVKIDDFTDNRASNYAQADEKLAKERGCSPEDIKKYRKENKLTWHECEDCKTMQLVPSEVHGNTPHYGGRAEYKNNIKNI